MTQPEIRVFAPTACVPPGSDLRYWRASRLAKICRQGALLPPKLWATKDYAQENKRYLRVTRGWPRRRCRYFGESKAASR